MHCTLAPPGVAPPPPSPPPPLPPAYPSYASMEVTHAHRLHQVDWPTRTHISVRQDATPEHRLRHATVTDGLRHTDMTPNRCNRYYLLKRAVDEDWCRTTCGSHDAAIMQPAVPKRKMKKGTAYERTYIPVRWLVPPASVPSTRTNTYNTHLCKRRKEHHAFPRASPGGKAAARALLWSPNPRATAANTRQVTRRPPQPDAHPDASEAPNAVGCGSGGRSPMPIQTPLRHPMLCVGCSGGGSTAA